MKKNNLKAGMVLITRGGESFLVLPYSGTSSNLYAFNTKNSNQVNLDGTITYLISLKIQLWML